MGRGFDPLHVHHSKGKQMATLYRDRDGEGHYGCVLDSINPETKEVKPTRGPVVGEMLFIGTMTAGMFSKRDWWRTNVVTEIIEETEHKVRFKTASGSIYTLER
jgi:hypothetical protein